METLFLAIAAVIFVYILVMRLLPESLRFSDNTYTRKRLDHLYKSTVGAPMLPDDEAPTSSLLVMLMEAPFLQPLFSKVLKAGLAESYQKVLLSMVGVFFLAMYAVIRFDLGFVGFLIALILSYLLPSYYLQRRIEKRTEAFLSMFPDALDMIVRSVSSGFPLSVALRMISENLDPPISTEFKQVVDEVTYGRSITEALQRLAARINEPDIRFFVVVLSVQQESGGNLAEILRNLSTIIRSRRQLRLKIRAMTSEGRATGWVLGSLPVFIFLILLVMSPEHLQPLFTTTMGNIMLATSAGLVLLSAWIVRTMVRIDI